MKHPALTKEFLNERFEYREGDLYYKYPAGKKKQGAKAGALYGCGSRQIYIHRQYYPVAAIIYYMFHDKYPEGRIYYIDGNRKNTKIENLRVESELTRETTQEEDKHACVISLSNIGIPKINKPTIKLKVLRKILDMYPPEMELDVEFFVWAASCPAILK